MPEFNSKKEWADAVNAYKAKHGTTRGFQKGKLQYIDSDGKLWSYAAGTRGGPGHPRSASSTDAYTDRRGSMEVDQTLGAADNNEAKQIFNKAGRNAGVEKGVHQMHHMRTLNQFEPLLAGLEGDDLEEALVWFQNEGFDLGNLEGNLKKQFNNAEAGGTTVPDTHQGKGSIHEWMRKHRLEPNTRQKEYKQIAAMFKGKSLNERLPMYVNYLEYVQGAIQEKLEVPTAYDWINNTRKQVGTIPSGPRAGQRMPVNRVTLGNAIIDDIVNTGGNIKFNMSPQKLAVLGLGTFSAFGTGASAIETGLRGKQALETGNPTDWVQTGLSAASLIADPIPAVGELISTPADAANVAIDTYREPGFKAAPNPLEARNQQLNNSLKTNPKPTPEPKYEAGYETLGRLGNQMLGGLKQVGGKILFGF